MPGLPEWRYFPELLRQLERAPGGPPCNLCAAPTEALTGPRATLEWCPRCHVLSVRERGGSRTLGVFSAAAHAPQPSEPNVDFEKSPSEVPRIAPGRPTVIPGAG